MNLVAHIKNECNDVDIKDPSHIFAVGFLLFVLTSCSILGTLFWMDIKAPIRDVSATHIDGPTRPGEYAKLDFTYTAYTTPRLTVIDQSLMCSDGNLYSNLVTRPSPNTVWPAGVAQHADLFVKIPNNVPSGSCWYTSEVRYHRYILPDITVKVPPIAVNIVVLEEIHNNY